MKIFLDANIFVAACGSATGGSRFLFSVAEIEASWHIVTSQFALQEARLNVQKKLPTKREIFEQLLISSQLTIIQTPPESTIKELRSIIAEKDAPILAAAVYGQVDVICTLDQKDFHNKKVKTWCQRFDISVLMPRDLLTSWRDSHDE